MTVSEKILAFTKRLYPKGRVFRIRNGSKIERLHKALNISETTAYNDALSVLDSILPDNDNFTIEDAERWEQRLGMIDGSNVPLADRKLAIARKMNHPGALPARLSADYLEQQLRDAGFDVYVYRNDTPLTPADIIGPLQTGIWETSTECEHAEQGNEHGIVQQGSVWGDMIANHIIESEDAYHNVGSNLHFTFFVGSNPLGTFANIDANRKEEFRQLILKLKPVNSAGFLFINYV